MDEASQDGAWAHRFSKEKYKEAAQRLLFGSKPAQHATRLDDLENRLRRNNVRTLGIPERAEGKNPVTFIE